MGTMRKYLPPGYKQPKETTTLLRIIAAGAVVVFLVLLICFLPRGQ